MSSVLVDFSGKLEAIHEYDDRAELRKAILKEKCVNVVGINFTKKYKQQEFVDSYFCILADIDTCV